MPTITWEIPIVTISEANCSQHWSKKAKRHKQQQFFIRIAMKDHVDKITLPCEVALTRLAPRELDFVNLTSSLKWIEDAVCDQLVPGLKPGRADGDKRIKTTFLQEKTKRLGVRIEISYAEIASAI